MSSDFRPGGAGGAGVPGFGPVTGPGGEGEPPSALTIVFGPITTQAVPVPAYKGANKRVHSRPEDACIDLATQELAQRWLKVCSVGDPSLSTIMGYMALDPDLFEGVLALVRTIKRADQTR